MEELKVREDGSEILLYNAPDFPISTDYSCLSIFAGYAAGCHWHRDFEVLIALDAPMDYSVNGQHVYLEAGDAIFVNSGRLHYGYSAVYRECHYCFAVFPPELLGMIPAVASMLEQFSRDSSPDYWLLSAGKEDEKQIIDLIRFLCDHADPRESLAVLSACAELIDRLAKMSIKKPDHTADPDWAVIRRMTGYIQNHYQEKIRLEDVAAAGAVCRSKCCQLFRDKLHTTPMNYVIRYRLEKACDLIRNGHSITDAAFSAGFQGTSYFSETFRKQYSMSPSSYTKSIHQATEIASDKNLIKNAACYSDSFV